MNIAAPHVINIIDAPEDTDPEPFRLMAQELLNALEFKRVEVSLAFVNDEEMRNLNLQFRGIDGTTDVLSFPFDNKPGKENNYLGDIAISYDTARNQAQEFGHSFRSEIFQLFAHGLLHLCGFDHESDDGQMEAIELKLRHDIVDRYCW